MAAVASETRASWSGQLAFVLAAPTLIASLYGMNIGLPFQNHAHAFSIVMGFSGLLAIAIGALFVVLSRKRKF